MYQISNRHKPTWSLMADFYSFVPNTRDQHLLSMDLRTLNPVTLRDAITECIEANKSRTVHYSAQRNTIHAVYVRKVKELAAIYPYLFAIENGLRSGLADRLELVFGRMDWWTIVRDAVLEGKGPEGFDKTNPRPDENPGSIIRGVEVTQAFVKYAFRVMTSLLDNKDHAAKIMGAGRTDEFYYCLTFGELWAIIDKSWSISRPMFSRDSDLGFNLTRKIYNDEMKVLKEARNAVFHSNPIRNRSVVVSCAEKVLNYLDFHFGDYDIALAQSQYTRPSPLIGRTKRHGLPG